MAPSSHFLPTPNPQNPLTRPAFPGPLTPGITRSLLQTPYPPHRTSYPPLYNSLLTLFSSPRQSSYRSAIYPERPSSKRAPSISAKAISSFPHHTLIEVCIQLRSGQGTTENTSARQTPCCLPLAPGSRLSSGSRNRGQRPDLGSFSGLRPNELPVHRHSGESRNPGATHSAARRRIRLTDSFVSQARTNSAPIQ